MADLQIDSDGRTNSDLNFVAAHWNVDVQFVEVGESSSASSRLTLRALTGSVAYFLSLTLKAEALPYAKDIINYYKPMNVQLNSFQDQFSAIP